MRSRHKDSLSNAWKRLNHEQKKSASDAINQQIRTGTEKGDLIKWQRDGSLNLASTQMTNYIETGYLRLGGRGGGTVGP